MFYFLVGLVPCYPVCHLLPTFVHRNFPSTPPVPPPPRIPLVGFPSTPPVAPPPPIPSGTTLGGFPAMSTQLCLMLVPPHREPFGCFEAPRYHVPAILSAVDHITVSALNPTGECSIDHKVARNSLRSSTMNLCQVLNCPPGLGFSPQAIVPNISRLGNHSLLCHATTLANITHRLRVVVSMLSQHVIVRAFAYVAWLAPLTEKSTWW